MAKIRQGRLEPGISRQCMSGFGPGMSYSINVMNHPPLLLGICIFTEEVTPKLKIIYT